MNSTASSITDMAGGAKRLAKQAAAAGHTRLELLLVEAQEERERWFAVLLLALGSAACGLLGGVALTISLVVIFWAYSPLAALLGVFLLSAAASACLCRRLLKLRRDWRSFPATFEQLKKDRECLEEWLD